MMELRDVEPSAVPRSCKVNSTRKIEHKSKISRAKPVEKSKFTTMNKSYIKLNPSQQKGLGSMRWGERSTPEVVRKDSDVGTAVG